VFGTSTKHHSTHKENEILKGLLLFCYNYYVVIITVILL